ncbi:DNA ligase 1-like [Hylaeus anthracinus]|uniref:DNA ligase 1-like n=1 Tax=Hylaeus anthracinus TaxID=313031 RepID=UPI0023B8A9A0|nr:DNA ligase 1-like [Hylaeus anthracinus]
MDMNKEHNKITSAEEFGSPSTGVEGVTKQALIASSSYDYNPEEVVPLASTDLATREEFSEGLASLAHRKLKVSKVEESSRKVMIVKLRDILTEPEPENEKNKEKNSEWKVEKSMKVERWDQISDEEMMEIERDTQVKGRENPSKDKFKKTEPNMKSIEVIPKGITLTPIQRPETRSNSESSETESSIRKGSLPESQQLKKIQGKIKYYRKSEEVPAKQKYKGKETYNKDMEQLKDLLEEEMETLADSEASTSTTNIIMKRKRRRSKELTPPSEEKKKSKTEGIKEPKKRNGIKNKRDRKEREKKVNYDSSETEETTQAKQDKQKELGFGDLLIETLTDLTDKLVSTIDTLKHGQLPEKRETKEVRQISTTKETWAKVVGTKKTDNGNVRKNEEALTATATEYTEDGRYSRSIRKKKPKWAAPKKDPVMIRIDESNNYKQSYERIKNIIEKYKGIKRLRKSRTDQLIIEMSDSGETEILKEDIIKNIGKDQVKTLQKKFDLEIIDVDPMVDKNDVMQALENINIKKEDMIVKVLRPTRLGTQKAIVELPVSYIKLIREKKKIKIGVINTKMEAAPKSIKCYRCHGLGHYSTNCKEKIKDNLRCRRCNTDGHKEEECSKPFQCRSCVHQRLPFEHRMGTMSYLVFRNTIKELKRQFNIYYADTAK